MKTQQLIKVALLTAMVIGCSATNILLAQGAQVDVYINGGHMYSGQLLAVNDDALFLSILYLDRNSDPPEWTKATAKIQTSGISKITVHEYPHLLRTVATSTLAGVGMGFVLAQGTDYPIGATMVSGGISGALAGLIIGTIANDRERVIQPVTKTDLIALQGIARFPKNMRENLSSIK